jgi:hypothetical protein
MKELMSTNIYDVKDEILICGKCIKDINKNVYNKLLEICPNVYGACLQETHIDMLISKITAMISTGKIKKIIFASVDGSPHCVQLHYIRKEINRRIKNLNYEIKNYVLLNDEIIEIDENTISLSKNLAVIKKLSNNK